MSEDVLTQLKSLLPKYGLEGTELKIIQSGGAEEHKRPGNLSLETGVGSKNQEEKIQLLENELRTLKDKDHLVQSVAKEINVLFPYVESFSFGDFLVQNVQDFTSSKEATILVKWKRPISDVEKNDWNFF
ncbi:hypothetical protein LEP1GSC043_1701 [Leptospira weilii str. Ecochallenge]|uniref:Uncharacterized protein n=1 Tax=Leptospira weilii str. Ecochallenge TaxID=1049986 RepID=N1UAS2_9LEPT|nr:hypothetical protein LEP1GSC043_1701 [Leptospira weilii str. Ecochallenge]